MPFITVNQGGIDLPDGVYPVILTDISDPKTVTAQRGPKAGQEIDLLDWTFAVDAPGNTYDGTVISSSTSTASGPRSKMFSYLTALFHGVAPAIGSGFEKAELVGRTALATVHKDDNGWPRIENLGAIPAAMVRQPAAKAAPAAPTTGETQLPF